MQGEEWLSRERRQRCAMGAVLSGEAVMGVWRERIDGGERAETGR